MNELPLTPYTPPVAAPPGGRWPGPYELTEGDALMAHGRWGMNCGPAALLGVSPTVVQAHVAVVGFASKRYAFPPKWGVSL